MEGSLTPGMQGWLDEDVNAARERWREYLSGLADYERTILADPEAWASVILSDLRARVERQRSQIIDAWGIDPAREDHQPGSLKRPTNVKELSAFLEAFWFYGIDRSTLEEVEGNAARVPEHLRSLEVCESYLSYCYAVPLISAVSVEECSDLFGGRSAQRSACRGCL